MLAEKFFISGYDTFPGEKALYKKGFRRLYTAEKFRHYRHFFIVDYLIDIGAYYVHIHAQSLCLGSVAFYNMPYFDVHAVVFHNAVVVCFQYAVRSAPYRA